MGENNIMEGDANEFHDQNAVVKKFREHFLLLKLPSELLYLTDY
jgi:hypothetical protein